ncbi:hypothetical protein ACWC9T_27610 [Kitasatospora sp. NPDC001159]
MVAGEGFGQDGGGGLGGRTDAGEVTDSGQHGREVGALGEGAADGEERRDGGVGVAGGGPQGVGGLDADPGVVARRHLAQPVRVRGGVRAELGEVAQGGAGEASVVGGGAQDGERGVGVAAEAPVGPGREVGVATAGGGVDEQELAGRAARRADARQGGRGVRPRRLAVEQVEQLRQGGSRGRAPDSEHLTE